jgi:UTP--glucose-1-phosphate uridylyltransferase
VDLDKEYFALLRDFDARFAGGPPSLVDCDRFVVRGDVSFGAGVVVRGEVEVSSADWPESVPDGTILGGSPG